MEIAWSLGTAAEGLATHPSGESFYIKGFNGLAHVDAKGQPIEEIMGPPEFDPAGGPVSLGMEQLVRVAQLDGDTRPEFVIFGSWGQTVSAVDDDGESLWAYPGPDTGTDDVWVADLDGDGEDEIIIGYNGSGGLHVVESSGEGQWADTSIGNCWHVVAGDYDADGTVEVLSTSAKPQISVYEPGGTPDALLDLGLMPNMVRVVHRGERSPVLVGAGHSMMADSVAFGMAHDGSAAWVVSFPAGRFGHLSEAMPALDRPWVALADMGGGVVVLDAESGSVIAESPPGFVAGGGLAWLSPPDEPDPILVAASDHGEAKGFRIVP
jgi:hypothetical protein